MKIKPGIVTRDGSTVYPTGIEWILAFAIRGVPWAITAWEAWIADDGNRWAGDGI